MRKSWFIDTITRALHPKGCMWNEVRDTSHPEDKLNALENRKTARAMRRKKAAKKLIHKNHSRKTKGRCYAITND